MDWSPSSWNLNTQKRQQEVDSYLSDARWWRRDIASERDVAERQAAQSKGHNPSVFNGLSDLLKDAERFLEKEDIAKPSHRQRWQEKLAIAENWEGKNVKHVPGQIREFIRRLEDCESEAAQLKELVAKTRRELRF